MRHFGTVCICSAEVNHTEKAAIPSRRWPVDGCVRSKGRKSNGRRCSHSANIRGPENRHAVVIFYRQAFIHFPGIVDTACCAVKPVSNENITFKNSRGDRLSGVLHRPTNKTPRGAVILCHGMDSNKNSEKLVLLAEQLACTDILALRFDFSYVGESSGCFANITCSGELDDLKAAYAVIKNLMPEKIAILGSSMGGTIALLLAAAEPEIAALVTIAAPLHPESFPRRILSEAQIAAWRERGFVIHNGRRLNVSLLDDLATLDLPRAARAVRCPTLVLHGDADEVVPIDEGYELDRCLPGPKRLSVLAGGDHRLSNPALMRRALEESLDWLMAHLR